VIDILFNFHNVFDFVVGVVVFDLSVAYVVVSLVIVVDVALYDVAVVPESMFRSITNRDEPLGTLPI
jgi:hypothetical protein